MRIETGTTDYMPGLTSAQKKDALSRMSYRDYLAKVVKVDPAALALYQSATQGEWGVGIDAVSALDCWGFGLPGFQGLKLDAGSAAADGLYAGRLRRRRLLHLPLSRTATPPSPGCWCAT